jgi:hypothetical protein
MVRAEKDRSRAGCGTICVPSFTSSRFPDNDVPWCDEVLDHSPVGLLTCGAFSSLPGLAGYTSRQYTPILLEIMEVRSIYHLWNPEWRGFNTSGLRMTLLTKRIVIGWTSSSTSRLMLIQSLLTWQWDTWTSLSQFENLCSVLHVDHSHYFRKQCLSVHSRLDSRSCVSMCLPEVLLQRSPDSSSYLKARPSARDSPPIVYQTHQFELAEWSRTNLEWRSSKSGRFEPRQSEFLTGRTLRTWQYRTVFQIWRRRRTRTVHQVLPTLGTGRRPRRVKIPTHLCLHFLRV